MNEKVSSFPLRPSPNSLCWRWKSLGGWLLMTSPQPSPMSARSMTSQRSSSRRTRKHTGGRTNSKPTRDLSGPGDLPATSPFPSPIARKAISRPSTVGSARRPKLEKDQLTGTLKLIAPKDRKHEMATYQPSKIPHPKTWNTETKSKLGKGEYHDNYEYLDLAKEKAEFIKHENDKVGCPLSGCLFAVPPSPPDPSFPVIPV